MLPAALSQPNIISVDLFRAYQPETTASSLVFLCRDSEAGRAPGLVVLDSPAELRLLGKPPLAFSPTLPKIFSCFPAPAARFPGWWVLRWPLPLAVLLD